MEGEGERKRAQGSKRVADNVSRRKEIKGGNMKTFQEIVRARTSAEIVAIAEEFNLDSEEKMAVYSELERRRIINEEQAKSFQKAAR